MEGRKGGMGLSSPFSYQYPLRNAMGFSAQSLFGGSPIPKRSGVYIHGTKDRLAAGKRILHLRHGGHILALHP